MRRWHTAQPVHQAGIAVGLITAQHTPELAPRDAELIGRLNQCELLAHHSSECRNPLQLLHTHKQMPIDATDLLRYNSMWFPARYHPGA